VGRLENIIDRNRHANRRSRERVFVSLFFGCAILVIIALMVFTDLGTPPMPKRDKHVDGVLLRQAPAHPTPPPNAAGSSR
jgi:hypothetical protein